MPTAPPPAPVNITLQTRCLDDTDTVSHIEGVVVGGQADVGLLLAVGADKGIDLLALNLVHLGHGVLNLAFVRFEVDDEDKSVVVLDLLHGRLGGERVFDDTVFIL